MGTGIGDLDLATGGLPTGSVWTIAGPAGAGVTALVTDIVTSVAHRGLTTLFVNGHLRSALLVSRTRQSRERVTRSVAVVPSNLWFASWWSLPWVHEHDDWHADGARVLVLDTLDEMLVTHARPIGAAEWQHMLRHLRRRAELLELSVIVTVRLPAMTESITQARHALTTHPAGDALVDVSDVVACLCGDPIRPHVRDVGVVHNRLGPRRVLRFVPSAIAT